MLLSAASLNTDLAWKTGNQVLVVKNTALPSIFAKYMNIVLHHRHLIFNYSRRVLR